MFCFIRNFSQRFVDRYPAAFTYPNIANAVKCVHKRKMFDGEQQIYAHLSATQNALMTFGAYLPPKALKEKVRCPVLYYLGDVGEPVEKFIKEAGAQRWAAKNGIILVNSDSSPRNIKELERYNEFNVGEGASFYVNATQQPWCKFFRMYTYITQELINVVQKCLPAIENCQSICGFGAGGHAALVCALRFWRKYRSVSAFAPIASIVHSPMTQHPLSLYLGRNKDNWAEFDAAYLAANYAGCGLNVMYDQGTADDWLKDGILVPEEFLKGVTKNGRLPMTHVMRDGYDHSYSFVSSFMEEHMAFHTQSLYKAIENEEPSLEYAKDCTTEINKKTDSAIQKQSVLHKI